jgi:predicted DsbA family dithiol-disulfide isomerase
MRRSILLGNAGLNTAAFSGFATDLGLDMRTFNGCVADGARFEPALQRDMKDGRSVGVTGTPSFVVGRPEGGQLHGILIAGARPYDTFSKAIEEFLADTP